ncbi:MAG: Hsp33 family molecular chaperone HslO [Desulfobacterales bacterium]|nr:Hsp33 family molecular chaperone HslO [Desulfobacterales bacterium]
MTDHLVRIMTKDGSLRACAAETTALVDAICQRQGTDLTASVALGRLVTGAALFGSLLKGEQRLALQIEANGPLQKLSAETDAYGRVRASIRQPISNLPPRNERFDVAGAIGKAGFLHVSKDLGFGEPYRGMVQLVSSEVAEDLAWYLTTSEQIPSSVGLGVLPRDNGHIAVAGGFLIQALPGADDAHLAELEQRLHALPPLTTLLREGLSPEAILARIFSGIETIPQATFPLIFDCSCSRQQALAILGLLPEEERTPLFAEKEITVTCEFCRERYSFTSEELAGKG